MGFVFSRFAFAGLGRASAPGDAFTGTRRPIKEPVCGGMNVEAPSDRGDPQPAVANRSRQRPQAASARSKDVDIGAGLRMSG